MRILIADDELAVRDALGRALDLRGLRGRVRARRPRDAASPSSATSRTRPSLDVMMPPPDGLEVCRRLRARRATRSRSSCSPRAARSPTASPASTRAPTTTSPKPFALDELLARLRALLRRVPDAAERAGVRRRRRSTRLAHGVAAGRCRLDADAHRVRAARAVPALARARALALRDPRRRLGLRLRPDLELARGLRRLPAPQARGVGGVPRLIHTVRGVGYVLRQRAMTLGRRVVLATSAALGAVVVLLSVFAYLLVKRELYSRVDVTLRDARDRARARRPSPATAGVPRRHRRSRRVRADALPPNGGSVRPPYQVTSAPERRARARDRRGVGLARRETIDVGGSAHAARDDARRSRTRRSRSRGRSPTTTRRCAGFATASRSSPSARSLLSVLLGSWIAEKALAPVRRLTRDGRGRRANARSLGPARRRRETTRSRASARRSTRCSSALDRSLTAQRRLVADASHEFRTPLTSIRANAELLERGTRAGRRAERRRARGRRPGGRARRPRHRPDRARARRRGGRRGSRTCASTSSCRVEVERMRRLARGDPLRAHERSRHRCAATRSGSAARSRTCSATR